MAHDQKNMKVILLAVMVGGGTGGNIIIE